MCQSRMCGTRRRPHAEHGAGRRRQRDTKTQHRFFHTREPGPNLIGGGPNGNGAALSAERLHGGRPPTTEEAMMRLSGPSGRNERTRGGMEAGDDKDENCFLFGRRFFSDRSRQRPGLQRIAPSPHPREDCSQSKPRAEAQIQEHGKIASFVIIGDPTDPAHARPRAAHGAGDTRPAPDRVSLASFQRS